MVQESNCTHMAAKKKKRKGTKWPRTVEVTNANEKEEYSYDGVNHGTQGAKEASDIPPSNPLLKPFFVAPTKGDKSAILKDDSNIGDPKIAKSLLNVIILHQDLAKYTAILMFKITNHHKELLYKVKSTSISSLLCSPLFYALF